MRNNAPRSKKAQLPAGLFCELMIEVTGRSRQPGATAAVASMVKKCFFCATEISGSIVWRRNATGILKEGKMTKGARCGTTISRLITLRTIIPICLRNGFFDSNS